jgi:hypothetical protein
MSLQFDNTNIRRKNPVKRNNKFFSGEDINLELDFAREYMEQDANQVVILYQVDLEKTQVNDIYKESKKDSIRFKTPIEIPCVYEIQDAELKAYNTAIQKGVYAKTGKLTFSVLISTLEELECDITRGDYIGVQITPTHMEYFTVTDDGRVGAFANKNTLYGTTPWYRKVECAPIDPNEFNG